jgi:hypothetical protein
MIYKVEAKKDQPLEEVKPEITRALQLQKVQQHVKTCRRRQSKRPKLDEAYFAGPAPPSLKEPGERAKPNAPSTGTEPSERSKWETLYRPS